ncbi:MAG: hypothetical protein MUF16_05765 [Burkholderiaceae bacterium]|jgi:predicted transcriptional regulator|nr:hypothetical protein [Burkholderiaceae bacterium]
MKTLNIGIASYEEMKARTLRTMERYGLVRLHREMEDLTPSPRSLAFRP